MLTCDPSGDFEAISPALRTNSIELGTCGGVSVDCSTVSATRDDGKIERGCLRFWQLDETLSGQTDGRSFRCSALNGTGTGVEHVKIDDLTIYDSNVSFESSAPITIEMRNSYLSHVWISLQGPVTLNVVDGGFDDVRVELGPDAKLALDRTDSERLMTFGLEGRYTGSVTARRAKVREGHLRAREVRLESVDMKEVSLDAEFVSAADLVWTNGTLRVDEATLAAVALSFVEVQECDALTILQSYMSSVRMAACKELLRVYTSTAENSAFDGVIQSDSSGFDKVRFGTSRTEIASWDTDFTDVLFCRGQRELWLGGDSLIECADCREAKALDGCFLPEAAGFAPEDVGCESLMDLPLCEEPFPSRERP
jgi:hypothetical protein